MKLRTYSDMRALATFEERFEYLRLDGEVGAVTFGFDRWINQQFYRTREWKLARQEVIVRDNGCDLGMPGYLAGRGAVVHHINPMTPDDLVQHKQWVLDPEYLVLVSHSTHNAIHYGDASLIRKPPVERRPGDTKLW